MGTTGRRSPCIGRVAVLAGGWEVRVPGEWTAVVIGLVTTDAERGRALVDRWIADMAGSAVERRVCAVQRPCVHEMRGRPGVAAVAVSAGDGKSFVLRVESVLHIIGVADDAVGAANLDPRVILRATRAG